jgi:hypothetical protein
VLTLVLKQIPSVLGIYGANSVGVPPGDYFPSSAARLHPSAAAAFAAVEEGTGQKLRCSDIFRSPEVSLLAMQRKSGVQPPGYSGHNFGFSIDVAVQACLKTFGKTKQSFDEMMISYGWYCHRKDHGIGSESWHYNHFGTGADAAPYSAACAASAVTSAGVEAKIVAVYGTRFQLSPAEIQTALKKLRLYNGDIDEDIGPRTRQAIAAFERAWLLPARGVTSQFMRTLAVVASEQNIT